jgi:alkanesulfonate monooxygenase SsuD/methylene tetrahydromethanopterin reductase-like flavin-dependent oxidoreductase (luciferase family)
LSPQRTPVLFQAGGSQRGQRFAGQHAELVFVTGANAAGIRRSVDAIKAFAVASGHAPDAIRFVAPVAVVTGSDDAAAANKLAAGGTTDAEGAVVHYSASTGIDFSVHDGDAALWKRLLRLHLGPGEDHGDGAETAEIFLQGSSGRKGAGCAACCAVAPVSCKCR